MRRRERRQRRRRRRRQQRQQQDVADFFGPRARIIGVDISPKTLVYEKNPEFGSPDRILIGDQSSAAFWAKALAQVGQVDAVLDDGGHQSYMQMATLEAVWPHLRKGGVFMTEDLGNINQAYTGALLWSASYWVPVVLTTSPPCREDAIGRTGTASANTRGWVATSRHATQIR